MIWQYQILGVKKSLLNNFLQINVPLRHTIKCKTSVCVDEDVDEVNDWGLIKCFTRSFQNSLHELEVDTSKSDI